MDDLAHALWGRKEVLEMAVDVLDRIRQQVNTANAGNQASSPGLSGNGVQGTSQPAAQVGDGQVTMPGTAPKRMASSFLS